MNRKQLRWNDLKGWRSLKRCYSLSLISTVYPWEPCWSKMDPGCKFPCFQSLRLHAATSQDQQLKNRFRVRWGRCEVSLLRNRSSAVIYCVCNAGFVRTAAKSKWQLCPECQVKCGRGKKKTSGSVSHLLFLFMYMYVCVGVCVWQGCIHFISIYEVIVRVCVCE